ncbi:MAG: hypothetical protein R3C14_20285 [Caldilineaceae bacterium]
MQQLEFHSVLFSRPMRFENEFQAITQSLRCYLPADLRLLLEGTGLTLHSVAPYASAWDYDKPVDLIEAEIFLAKLVRAEG